MYLKVLIMMYKCRVRLGSFLIQVSTSFLYSMSHARWSAAKYANLRHLYENKNMRHAAHIQ